MSTSASLQLDTKEYFAENENMTMLTTKDELAPFGFSLSWEEVLALLTTPTADHLPLLHTMQVVIRAGHEADALLVERKDFRLIINIRSAGGETPPEQHRDWHDVSLYLAGENTVAVEGTVDNAKEIASGEWRGGILDGARQFIVRSGDILIVSAGTPHQNHFLPHTAFVIAKVRTGHEQTSPLAMLSADWRTVTHIPRYRTFT